jgi:hypothetical protein
VRTNDLLNAVQYLTDPDDPGAVGSACPGLSMPERGRRPEAPWTPLVGDKYYAIKDQLIHDEQVLLRSLHFNIGHDHPHGYLLNICNVLQCSCQLAQTAICLLNDSLMYTDMCTRTLPWDLAAGALHLASLLLGVAHELPYEVCAPQPVKF